MSRWKGLWARIALFFLVMLFAFGPPLASAARGSVIVRRFLKAEPVSSGPTRPESPVTLREGSEVPDRAPDGLLTQLDGAGTVTVPDDRRVNELEKLSAGVTSVEPEQIGRYKPISGQAKETTQDKETPEKPAQDGRREEDEFAPNETLLNILRQAQINPEEVR